MAKKTPELMDALKRLTLYPMRKCRMYYFLARVAQYVDMAFSEQKARGSLDQYFDLEIEHILPDNPKNDLRNTWQEKHPELIYDEYKNRLGNLTLLEKTINIVAGNDSWADKISQYAKSANYLTRSLSGLTEVGQNTSISHV